MRSWIYITDGWTEEHESNSGLPDFKSGIRDICDRRIFSIASKLKPERIDRMMFIAIILAQLPGEN